MNEQTNRNTVPRPESIHRILVPVDFSDSTRRTIHYAKSLADKLDAHIQLLYVVPTTLVPLEAYELTPDYGTLVKWGEQNLAKLQEELFPDAAQVSCEVKNGHPPQEIIDAAQHSGCDLIIMSTHGHGGVRHLLMGSTTEKVVRLSSIPVLTLHGTKR